MAYEKTETHRARARKWAASNKDKKRASELKRKFGLSVKDWDKMYNTQEGKCAICKIHQSELVRRFCVDHDHNTGQIRGLLCDDCNTGIGLLKDNPELLKEAARYLQVSLK